MTQRSISLTDSGKLARSISARAPLRNFRSLSTQDLVVALKKPASSTSSSNSSSAHDAEPATVRIRPPPARLDSFSERRDSALRERRWEQAQIKVSTRSSDPSAFNSPLWSQGFTAWMNSYLKKRAIKIQDLPNDMKVCSSSRLWLSC